MRKLIANYARLRTTAGDAGMSTVEYAIGTMADHQVKRTPPEYRAYPGCAKVTV